MQQGAQVIEQKAAAIRLYAARTQPPASFAVELTVEKERLSKKNVIHVTAEATRLPWSVAQKPAHALLLLSGSQRLRAPAPAHPGCILTSLLPPTMKTIFEPRF
ncbi:hypothetical protein ACJJTC_001603 [Scirpophaga incertulas]